VKTKYFKQGGATNSQSSSEKKRLDGQGRPEGCLLYGPNNSLVSTLFKIGKKAYQFNYHPFGLCTAPRVFTKILKPSKEISRNPLYLLE